MLMMRSFLLSAVMILVAGSTASAQDRSFDLTARVSARLVLHSGLEAIIDRVRSLDRMTYRVGFGLAAGEFHSLSQEALRAGTPDDFKRLLTDWTPLVRVLGLICLAQSVSAVEAEVASAAASLDKDKAVIMFTNGCVMDQTSTVADITRRIVEGRFFLAGEGIGRR
jgi:hypothetical protein